MKRVQSEIMLTESSPLRGQSRVVVALANSILLLAISCGIAIGCGTRTDTSGPTGAPQASSERDGQVTTPFELLTELNESQQQQKEIALAAKDELFKRLSNRLMGVLQNDGAAKAIEVCRVDASAFSEQVGHEFGVEIGRTSFKLRSGANPSPDWANKFVEDRIDEPRFVTLPQDAFGAFLPIMLQKKCEICHGPEEQIASDVRDALKLHYPNDKATGFSEGDLRGWFWIEVPRDAKLPSHTSEQPKAEARIPQSGSPTIRV
ncbi:MAG: DUF3365 domain-containing protein [Planctomycetaceae bacterium]